MIQNIRTPIEYLAIYPFSSKALKAMRELKSSLFPGHESRLKRFVCVHVSFLRLNSRNYFDYDQCRKHVRTRSDKPVVEFSKNWI